jgi:hypothetical protein
VPFKDLGLPELGPTPVNIVSEKVMEGTIPFALGWAAVLTGVSIGARLTNKKTETAQAQGAANHTAEEKK